MERKIGEIFAVQIETGVVRLKVTEDQRDPRNGYYCNGCYFYNNDDTNCNYCSDELGPCDYMTRTDRKSVIFKKIDDDEMPSINEMLEIIPKVDEDGYNFTIRYDNCFWSIGYTKFVQEKRFWEWNSKHHVQSRRFEDALAQFFKTFE